MTNPLYAACLNCIHLFRQFGPKAHEVTNKLTVASGALDVARRGMVLDDKLAHMIDLAVVASHELAGIIYTAAHEIGRMERELEINQRENSCSGENNKQEANNESDSNAV